MSTTTTTGAEAVIAAAEQNASRPGGTVPDSAAASLAVLVAEDNDINALLTRSLLTRLGHRPEVAPDGAAAIEAWQAAQDSGSPYDLILMGLVTIFTLGSVSLYLVEWVRHMSTIEAR